MSDLCSVLQSSFENHEKYSEPSLEVYDILKKVLLVKDCNSVAHKSSQDKRQFFYQFLEPGDEIYDVFEEELNSGYNEFVHILENSDWDSERRNDSFFFKKSCEYSESFLNPVETHFESIIK